jgi:hypothetical protein
MPSGFNLFPSNGFMDNEEMVESQDPRRRFNGGISAYQSASES